MKLINFLFNSNIWLASGAAALSAATCYQFDEKFNFKIIALTFFYFLLIYNVHGILNRKKNRLFDKTTFDYYKGKYSLIFCVLSMMLYGFILIPLSLYCKLIGVFYLIGGFSYGSLVLPFKKDRKKLKDKAWFKTLSTVIVIVSFLFAFPYLVVPIENTEGVVEWMLFLFIHISTNTLIGDMRDMKVDKYHKSKTIAIVLGFSLMKKLLLAVNILMCLYWTTFQFRIEYAATIVVTILFLSMLKESTKTKFYNYIDIAHFVPLLSLMFLG